MPITCQIDTTANVIFETWTGTLTKAEVRGHWKTLLATPDAQRCRRILADLRQLKVHLSWAEVDAIAQEVLVPMLGPGGWRVAEVVSADVQHGRAMQFKAATESVSSHAIFRDYDAALAWVLDEASD